MSHFSYLKGELYAESVALAEIAERHSTPTFIYSRAAITEAYQAFTTAFSQKAHRVCYAVKANSNLGVLSVLEKLGAHFDIVSGGELARLQKLGIQGDRIVFSGVGKQQSELDAALKLGISCFNVESQQELSSLASRAKALGKIAPISIRVNPDVDAKTHPYISTGLKENKFGVSLDAAKVMYQDAADSPYLQVVGIDCHIGSQLLTLSPFLDALERVLQLVDDLTATGIEFHHIDLGGGMGVQYHPDETALDIEAYAGAVIQHMGKRPQELWFEPGRSIVANAGVLLARVINLKDNEGKHFCVVDAAMNDLIRPALYQAWQGVRPVKAEGTGKPKSYDVVGPVCETGDFLAKDRMLDVAAGDLLCIDSAGAYGFVMSSNYNSRNRAAEVLVDGHEQHLVRERETFEYQLSLEHPI
ncbi:MAG: diaminopimelate decarboxylase [Candidatus Azotimanducaceae bacterium]|jgi:diaminopimelate decarboxylase